MIPTISEAMKQLKAHRKQLTRQQVRTLKGQILAGDIAGAMKGLDRIINKRKGEKNMNQTTRETRRESYDTVLPKVNERARLILETLGNREMTVSEITDELVDAGKIPYYNRNYVAPRLTELKDEGIVETCGRRKSTKSNVHEAVWRRAEASA